MKISERIKELRTKNKLKQSELANKIGIARVSLGNYERGTRVANIDVISKIANALNMSLIDFLRPCDEGKAFLVKECYQTTREFLEEKRFNESLTKNERIEFNVFNILKELELENLFWLKNDIEALQKKIIQTIKSEACKKINEIEIE